MVREAWTKEVDRSNSLGSAWISLAKCKTSLKAWSKAKFGNAERQIAFLSKRLDRLQNKEFPANLATIKQVQADLNKLFEMKEIKWRQRAKRNWFFGGDRNTQFFHAWTNQRRRTDFIGSTKDMVGTVWTKYEEIGEAFKGYFQHLFTFEEVEAGCPLP